MLEHNEPLFADIVQKANLAYFQYHVSLKKIYGL